MTRSNANLPLRRWVQSLLDAEQLRGWLERHTVNSLLRQLYGIQANDADLIALFRHRDMEPILLLYGGALALCVTSPLENQLFRLLGRSFD